VSTDYCARGYTGRVCAQCSCDAAACYYGDDVGTCVCARARVCVCVVTFARARTRRHLSRVLAARRRLGHRRSRAARCCYRGIGRRFAAETSGCCVESTRCDAMLCECDSVRPPPIQLRELLCVAYQIVMLLAFYFVGITSLIAVACIAVLLLARCVGNYDSFAPSACVRM
jgi:hypothetical protein